MQGCIFKQEVIHQSAKGYVKGTALYLKLRPGIASTGAQPRTPLFPFLCLVQPASLFLVFVFAHTIIRQLWVSGPWPQKWRRRWRSSRAPPLCSLILASPCASPLDTSYFCYHHHLKASLRVCTRCVPAPSVIFMFCIRLKFASIMS